MHIKIDEDLPAHAVQRLRDNDYERGRIQLYRNARREGLLV